MTAVQEDINWQVAFVESGSENTKFTPSESELKQAQLETSPDHSLVEVSQLPPTDMITSGATVTGKLAVDYRNIITPIKSQRDCGSWLVQKSVDTLQTLAKP